MRDSSLIHLVPTLWRHKWMIIGSTALAGLCIALIMLALPDYYKSTTVFYPVHSTLLDPSSGESDQVYYFGDDGDADRLLSIAKSLDLKKSLIKEYDLAKHYEIDITDNKGKVKLIKTLTKNLSVFKNQYDAIELSVEDKDPMMSQQLVIAAQRYIDATTIGVIHESQKRIVSQLSSQKAQLSTRLSEVTDSLLSLRSSYGIYSTKSQAEALTTMEIKNPQSSAVRSRIKNYSEGVSAVVNLEEIQRQLNEELSKIVMKEQQMTTSLQSDISALHIIEKASVPLEKSRPKRARYVLAAMMAIGLLACALVLIREQLTA